MYERKSYLQKKKCYLQKRKDFNLFTNEEQTGGTITFPCFVK